MGLLLITAIGISAILYFHDINFNISVFILTISLIISLIITLLIGSLLNTSVVSKKVLNEKLYTLDSVELDIDSDIENNTEGKYLLSSYDHNGEPCYLYITENKDGNKIINKIKEKDVHVIVSSLEVPSYIYQNDYERIDNKILRFLFLNENTFNSNNFKILIVPPDSILTYSI